MRFAAYGKENGEVSASHSGAHAMLACVIADKVDLMQCLSNTQMFHTFSCRSRNNFHSLLHVLLNTAPVHV